MKRLPHVMQALEQALAEVAAAVAGFKPPSGEALSAQLKRVASYKSPGVYVMHAKHAAQAEELKQAAAANGFAAAVNPNGSRASSQTASAASPRRSLFWRRRRARSRRPRRSCPAGRA